MPWFYKLALRGTIGAPSVCCSGIWLGTDTESSATPMTWVSQEFPFFYLSQPSPAYISMQHEFSVDEEGKEHHHGNWHGLHIVDLKG
jgi:hypothetical protein